MVLKVFYFLIIVFVVLFVSLFVQDGYSDFLKDQKLNINLELHETKNYALNFESISRLVSAKLIMRFTDHDEFDYPKVELLKGKFSYILSADKAYLKNDILRLSENVVFFRDDNLSLSSSEVFYDIKKKLIFSYEDTHVKFPKFSAKSKYFSYDLENKILNINSIHATFKDNL